MTVRIHPNDNYHNIITGYRVFNDKIIKYKRLCIRKLENYIIAEKPKIIYQIPQFV